MFISTPIVDKSMKIFRYLTPHAFWIITDFDGKCEKCEMINTITLEEGEL